MDQHDQKNKLAIRDTKYIKNQLTTLSYDFYFLSNLKVLASSMFDTSSKRRNTL